MAQGPQKQYTKEMKSHFGYYAAWTPGSPRELGHIGVLDGNVFTHVSDLQSRLGAMPATTQDPTTEDLDYQSSGSVTTTAKLSGAATPTGSILTQLDAGIIVEFSRQNATLFRALNCTTTYIADTISLGQQVLDLYRAGKWNKQWVIITELVVAESATILISESRSAKIELKATANLDAPQLDIADAKFNFAHQFVQGMDTRIIAKNGLTPLFKVMGIKDPIFARPSFNGVAMRNMSAHLLTPELAAGELKDQLHFDVINNANSAFMA